MEGQEPGSQEALSPILALQPGWEMGFPNPASPHSSSRWLLTSSHWPLLLAALPLALRIPLHSLQSPGAESRRSQALQRGPLRGTPLGVLDPKRGPLCSKGWCPVSPPAPFRHRLSTGRAAATRTAPRAPSPAEALPPRPFPSRGLPSPSTKRVHPGTGTETPGRMGKDRRLLCTPSPASQPPWPLRCPLRTCSPLGVPRHIPPRAVQAPHGVQKARARGALQWGRGRPQGPSWEGEGLWVLH